MRYRKPGSDKPSNRLQTAVLVGAFLVGAAGAGVACSGTANDSPVTDSSSALPNGHSGAACKSCIQNSECSSDEACAQFGSDSYCAKSCGDGTACGADETCTTVTGTDGTALEACVPNNDTCSESVAQGAPGDTSARGGKTLDAGPPPSGSVGIHGGSLSRLYFSVIGDTRPPVINDTSGYPTAIITKIWQDVEALPARPAFVIGTGDYQFSTSTGNQAGIQIDKYLTARAAYSNVFFPAIGNHECTGATKSNCGPGASNGITNNYTAFMQKLLAPIQQTNPNYEIDVDAVDKSWTSKFVFVAGNAWSSADATWLDGVLAKPTTYTFIVRHEPKAACSGGPPGCSGSETIMAKHPYTLAIVGHTHTYGKTGPKQVTIGNGGAPLVGGGNYGFAVLDQRADGAITVDMIDYQTGKADAAFHFAVKADGSAAPP